MGFPTTFDIWPSWTIESSHNQLCRILQVGRPWETWCCTVTIAPLHRNNARRCVLTAKRKRVELPWWRTLLNEAAKWQSNIPERRSHSFCWIKAATAKVLTTTSYSTDGSLITNSRFARQSYELYESSIRSRTRGPNPAEEAHKTTRDADGCIGTQYSPKKSQSNQAKHSKATSSVKLACQERCWEYSDQCDK